MHILANHIYCGLARSLDANYNLSTSYKHGVSRNSKSENIHQYLDLFDPARLHELFYCTPAKTEPNKISCKTNPV